MVVKYCSYIVLLCIYAVFINFNKTTNLGTSLVVQWLGLQAFTAEGIGSVPG